MIEPSLPSKTDPFQLVEKDHEMSRKAELKTAAATLACAFGIGFVMQSGEVANARYSSENMHAANATPTLGDTVALGDLETISMPDRPTAPTISDIILTSADMERSTPAVSPQKPVMPVLNESFDFPATLVPLPAACLLTATATPDAAAMVRLIVSAPCKSSEEIVISHHKMAFVEMTSETGTLDILVPALSTDAAFTITFDTGESVKASALVPSLDLYDRVVLQWSGASGIEIHARESGAEYGSEGHLWVGSPRDIAAVVAGSGGIIMRHGNPLATVPMIAEVYTFPAASNQSEGSVSLSVETEVTKGNCGTDITTQAFHVSRGGEVETQALVLSVPGCEAIGNFLVLNNPFKDLKVASN